MKKVLLYSVTLLCLLSFITACSDDDKTTSWQDISKTYSGNQLDLGTALIGSVGSVTVDAVSEEKANLTLTDIIPGENEVSLSATLQRGGMESSMLGDFRLQGTATTSSCGITVRGYILNGVLKLDIVRTMTSPIVGNWNLTIANGLADVFITVKGTAADELLNSLGPLLGQLLAQKVEKVSASFGENGQLVIGYKMPGANTVELPPAEVSDALVNLLTWYEKDGTLYLALRKDVVGLLSELLPLLAGIDITPYLSLLELSGSYYVVPLQATVEGNSARLYVTKDFVQKVWPVVKTLIPEDNTFATFIPIIDGVITSAQSVEVGLGFTR
ncbi:hypothetical protein [Parabacteroides bouchesdurhonensis]|uniref:hypothetical protein n=1 Tax=Parabacteroides bouchesdurhonensis TaxID=1936995 RepID=UPI00131BA075|nr:hypothetical protein [Parabacteroides bouchesdurhonensis]